jgi:hypothetical protein
MDEIGCELKRQAGEDRRISYLDDFCVAKWKAFFGLDPELPEIQRLIFDSDLLCLSEEYSFSGEFSLAAPAAVWNKAHGLLISVDFFSGNVLGFLTRREINEQTRKSELKFE